MLQTIYQQTPLLQSYYHHQLGREVFYKMDCYQPSGSFKIRGMEHLCKRLIANGHRRFIASSGGNAGYSLAYVGQKLGVEIQVVVPETTPQMMVNRIRMLGAKVKVFGADWNAAHQYASEQSASEQIPYVPPFDHELLWEGHASVIAECAEDMDAPDTIVVSVGGGGLLNGVLLGMRQCGWNSKVIAAETTGAASFAAAFDAGHLVTLDEISTIATSLGARQVSAKSLELSKDFDLATHVVSDALALQACERLMAEANVLVEPACGAALSYAYNLPDSDKDEKILVIVCGGVCMDIELFEKYQSIVSG
ncbi:MAG: pyridoxal-phosphate dependent enzyme [Bacteroidota bacterium]